LESVPGNEGVKRRRRAPKVVVEGTGSGDAAVK
jgi:hypothetical protein